MLNVANLPAQLEFVRELLGNRCQQYRHAYWLKNAFEENAWVCDFDNRKTFINFNICFPDGTKLVDGKHIELLEIIKCFICVQTHPDATEGKKLNALSNCARIGKALKIIDYFLLRLEHYPLHIYGLSSLTYNDFMLLLLDIGRYQYIHQSIYQWHERLALFLKEKITQENPEILENILKACPILKNHQKFIALNTLRLSEEELAKARAWLYLHNCYFHAGENNISDFRPNNNRLARLIYANTLGGTETNFPIVPELSYQLSIFKERECKSVTALHVNDENTLSENDFMGYISTLQHFCLLKKINLPVPDETIKKIQPQILMESLKLKQSKRFLTLPSSIVFNTLRSALEFALAYGEDLIDSYLMIMKSVKESGNTFGRWLKINKDITPYVTSKIQALGVVRWKIHRTKESRTFRDHTYYQRLRAHEGLWDLLRVLYGAIQIVVGTLMARRFSELADLMPMSCLDQEGTYLIFFVGKTGFIGTTFWHA